MDFALQKVWFEPRSDAPADTSGFRFPIAPARSNRRKKVAREETSPGAEEQAGAAAAAPSNANRHML